VPYARIAAETGAINQLFQAFDLRRYGGDPTGRTTSTEAFRTAIEVADNSTLIRAPAVGDVGAYSGSAPAVIVAAPGFYTIDDDLPLGVYTNVIATVPGVFIKQLDPTKKIFTGTPPNGAGYFNILHGMHLIGGLQQVVMQRLNSDTSMVLLSSLTHSDADPDQFAIDLNCRSGIVKIERARVLSAPRWITSVDTDQLTIRDCWVNGYDKATQQKPVDSASYYFGASAGTNQRVSIQTVLHVPEPGTAGHALADTRWIDLDDYVDLDIDGNTQFGGENGGYPIVNFVGQGAALPAASAYPQGGGIRIRGGQLTPGESDREDRGVVILRNGIPNRISIEHGTQIGNSYLVNVLIPGGAAAWIAANTDANHPRIAISLIGNQGVDITPIGADVLGVQTATTDLDAYAVVWSPESVGGNDPFKVPVLGLQGATVIPGTGDPDTVVAAAVGSLFLRLDGGAGTSFYVKESGGSTSSGWVAK